MAISPAKGLCAQSQYLIFLFLLIGLTACNQPTGPSAAATLTATAVVIPTPLPINRSYRTGAYPDLFTDLLGKSEEEVEAKLNEVWEQLFYGNPSSQTIFYSVGEDMAYIKDIGNNDIRSEGMSYGMMIAVQMDKHEEFDRIWQWAKTYMYHEDGPYAGYFSWHNNEDGSPIDANPASDGEAWMVTALLFASHRWGDGEGIFNYSEQANEILHTMRHKEEDGTIATNLFDEESNQIVFVPMRGRVSQFTDPSYHVPHYYQLWAEWADEDNAQWLDAAVKSRAFWKTAVQPETGLFPDYAEFDGTPTDNGSSDYHKDFRFDAWRTGMNIAMDYIWFAKDEWAVEQSNRWLDFFVDQGLDSYVNQYTLDGEPLSNDRSPGLVAMNAVTALAANHPRRTEFVQALWDLQVPSGRWRYYDGMLVMLALLQVSGNFEVYGPDPNS